MAFAQLDFDVLVIGAGISGINAAYRVQSELPKGTRYAIFEGRSSLGGTWDFFRYPGIRSDSDIFTFGFAWKPWTGRETIAHGADIKKYMEEATRDAGIDSHIHYHHRVREANWSSKDKCWEVTVAVGDGSGGDDKIHHYRTRFMVLGTGYYDYDAPLKSKIPGLENFAGKVIHPQFWPEDYDYTDKHLVVVGSGATAITVVPAVTGRAKHVTMLQRSPTYVMPLPRGARLIGLMRALLPASVVHVANRALWIAISYFMIYFCRVFPGLARRAIRRTNQALLPSGVPVDPHFTPRYRPWQQRLCASADGDLFAALRSGGASVVTDRIARVTADAIELESGAELRPDAIVTATGLGLRFAGGIRLSLDGTPFDVTQKFIWRAAMIQDLPNVVYVIGYENASWTLGADCAARVLVRLVRELGRVGGVAATPRLASPERMEVKPLLSLSSSYLKDASSVFPKGGTGTWRPRATYLQDLYTAKYCDITKDLEIV